MIPEVAARVLAQVTKGASSSGQRNAIGTSPTEDCKNDADQYRRDR